MARKFICTTTEPIVETKAGKLRGFIIDGTYTFHGIKYCDAKRFQMPTEVTPWNGVKDALSYGFVCPMLGQDTPNGEVMVPHRYWPMDENCQYLNIWTQSVDTQAKKPVMLWLHGGGFAAGSSIEQVSYDGENLSKEGDVVVVSLNHRINILGYLDLSPFGEKYRNSANAGNADIVAALRWIHDNIEAFGGDPDNVTIFGQSGGGMKVWTLMQTPEADGLFHKGIIESGLIDGFMDSVEGDGTTIVNALMKELGIANVEELETVEYAALAKAYNKVSPQIMMQGHYAGGNPIPNEFYAGDPREVGFTEHAKTIPVIIGTVFGEFSFGPGIADRHTMSEEAKLELLKAKYKDGTQRLVEEFQKAYPEKNLTDLLFFDSMFRKPTIDFIAKKSQCQESATYAYVFTYEFPLDEGKPAWHCSEIPFVFHNTDKVFICNKEDVSDRLEAQMSQAWIQFAKTGVPKAENLPEWEACKPGDEATMIFDEKCEIRHNYDHKLVEIHNEVAPPFQFMTEEIQH